MKRLGDNNSIKQLKWQLTDYTFKLSPKFVQTIRQKFSQINGVGLIHKSARGSELGVLSLGPTHCTHWGCERVLGSELISGLISHNARSSRPLWAASAAIIPSKRLKHWDLLGSLGTVGALGTLGTGHTRVHVPTLPLGDHQGRTYGKAKHLKNL